MQPKYDPYLLLPNSTILTLAELIPSQSVSHTSLLVSLMLQNMILQEKYVGSPLH